LNSLVTHASLILGRVFGTGNRHPIPTDLVSIVSYQ